MTVESVTVSPPNPSIEGEVREAIRAVEDSGNRATAGVVQARLRQRYPRLTITAESGETGSNWIVLPNE